MKQDSNFPKTSNQSAISAKRNVMMKNLSSIGVGLLIAAPAWAANPLVDKAKDVGGMLLAAGMITGAVGLGLVGGWNAFQISQGQATLADTKKWAFGAAALGIVPLMISYITGIDIFAITKAMIQVA